MHARCTYDEARIRIHARYEMTWESEVIVYERLTAQQIWASEGELKVIPFMSRPRTVRPTVWEVDGQEKIQLVQLLPDEARSLEGEVLEAGIPLPRDEWARLISGLDKGGQDNLMWRCEHCGQEGDRSTRGAEGRRHRGGWLFDYLKWTPPHGQISPIPGRRRDLLSQATSACGPHVLPATS